MPRAVFEDWAGPVVMILAIAAVAGGFLWMQTANAAPTAIAALAPNAPETLSLSAGTLCRMLIPLATTTAIQPGSSDRCITIKNQLLQTGLNVQENLLWAVPFTYTGQMKDSQWRWLQFGYVQNPLNGKKVQIARMSQSDLTGTVGIFIENGEEFWKANCSVRIPENCANLNALLDACANGGSITYESTAKARSPENFQIPPIPA